MTILEALNIEVNKQDLAEKYLTLLSLVPTDDYTLGNSEQVELAKAYCFKSIVTQPDFSEDGLSVEYDRKYLTMEANRIFDKNNLPEEKIGVGKPTVKNKTGIW